MTTMTLNDLVEKFITIREKKSQLKAEYEANVAKYDAVAEKIEAMLLKHFSEQGVDSVKTPAGTAYTTIRSAATIADWDQYRAWLAQQEDPYVFLERRVSKNAVETYKAANDELPPGVNWSETRVVNFRKS